MKMRNRVFAKFALVVFGFLILNGLVPYIVKAQKQGCQGTQACTTTWTNSCHCGDSDCDGCYIPNGQGGCGTCRQR